MRRLHLFTPAPLALALLALAPAAPAAEVAETPRADESAAWESLDALRRGLEGATLVADFEQEFLPAGFSDGEIESGRIAISLPECLRWDYGEPFPKSYLLCGAQAYTWNPGEPAGRRFIVSADEEPGLDLLRLRVAALRSRYRASRAAESDGAIRVRLEPTDAAAIRDAELLLDPAGGRLRELSYRDSEGNRTRFRFAAYREESAPDLFEPPPGLRWLEE